MVSIDIDIKGIVGIAEANAIDKKKFEEFLNKFDKKDIVEYLISITYLEEESEEEPVPSLT